MKSSVLRIGLWMGSGLTVGGFAGDTAGAMSLLEQDIDTDLFSLALARGDGAQLDSGIVKKTFARISAARANWATHPPKGFARP